MQEVKTKVATAVTVAVLAGLTGVAMSSGGQEASEATADQQASRPQVVRRTIHVTKRADAATVAGTTAPAGAAPIVGGSSGLGSGAAPAPVSTSSSGSGASAPSSSGNGSPVVTHSSGSGSGSHGGGDDDGADDRADAFEDREDAREDYADDLADYEEDLADDGSGHGGGDD